MIEINKENQILMHFCKEILRREGVAHFAYEHTIFNFKFKKCPVLIVNCVNDELCIQCKPSCLVAFTALPQFW